MRKALVIGAGGYLGSAVTERMMLHGFDVVAASRGIRHRVCELCPLVHVDAEDYEQVSKLVGSARPDVIVNCAGMSSTPASFHFPVKSWEDNFDAAFNVLEAARIFRVSRVVLASSNVVYGSDSVYRAAKLAMEAAASAYRSSFGMSVMCLRYGNIYGEGCKRGFVTAAVEAWKSKKPLVLSGHRENTRHWVHVGDAAEVTAMAASATGYCGWTDVAPSKTVSLGRIVDLLPGLETVNAEPLPGDAFRLPQTPCAFKDRWTDLEAWLCGL